MDTNQLNELLGLASSAVNTTGQAASNIAKIKKLFEGGKSSMGVEEQRLLTTLASEVSAANFMNVQISGSIKELRQDLQRQDEFEKEKARYELFQTDQNDLVYKLREDAANGQPDHFICPVCLHARQLVSFITGERDHKICQTNGAHAFRFTNTPTQRRQEKTWISQ